MADKLVTGSPENCTCPDCRATLVETRAHAISATGCRTQFYLCLDCIKGIWIRWAPDKPGKWVAVGDCPQSSSLVGEALRGLGWRRLKAGSSRWWEPPA